jgi:hypothetical protein
MSQPHYSDFYKWSMMCYQEGDPHWRSYTSLLMQASGKISLHDRFCIPFTAFWTPNSTENILWKVTVILFCQSLCDIYHNLLGNTWVFSSLPDHSLKRFFSFAFHLNVYNFQKPLYSPNNIYCPRQNMPHWVFHATQIFHALPQGCSTGPWNSVGTILNCFNILVLSLPLFTNGAVT